jgi:hypothetical protein
MQRRGKQPHNRQRQNGLACGGMSPRPPRPLRTRRLTEGWPLLRKPRQDSVCSGGPAGVAP